jgi:superfamily II DNA helicase RecQ
VDPEAENKLKLMFRTGTARFRSLHQYQVYHVLKNPGQIVLNVAATGSGKTLPYQLAVYTAPPPATSLMVVPYNVLYGEMERRMKEVGLTVEKYQRSQPFPQAKVVLVSLEVLGSGEELLRALRQEEATGRLKCVVIDEACKWYGMYT